MDSDTDTPRKDPTTKEVVKSSLSPPRHDDVVDQRVSDFFPVLSFCCLAC